MNKSNYCLTTKKTFFDELFIKHLNIDAISNNLIIPFSLFINNFLYMITYVSLASICAVVLFQNKEIAKGVRQ